MTWNEFQFFALPAIVLWISGGIAVYAKTNRKFADVLMLGGILVFAAYIIGLWIELERPPMRTMGETRLWYSFFLSSVGLIAYRHWKYKWLLTFSSLVASVFVCINMLKPEIHSKYLMPALQSYWFIPHVTVYILSYSILGAAAIASIIQLRNLGSGASDKNLYRLMDNLVYTGFGLLMLGMLMGCVWAKAAWGQFWGWDPKETWAFVTAAAYLVYLHARLKKTHPRFALWVLLAAFIFLMITWIGVNYLPAARGSVHTY
jgi:ABC-type transport system involved in cytochrome c biogenesis permease subunit